MAYDAHVNMEPLPGYRLIEQIGSGGYGEVWRAEAPGGLTKAIKFVFGQQHEKRATNEIRAMERVRTVRHPFLLSLERIEVVEGRLLVVTELADASLKDRFDACRHAGNSGIPRDELLRYLRDAADALDFMIESHALQHLDIKPENLLLLAGHVKVADFGLVKDVRQSQASLVGGMTPLYAAPEVFRGTPSSRSDQYSLAIVYIEMLTGTLPFAGGNAAELTLQHLNDEPHLSALPATDRYAVSRALAKDPPHRYASCREFIDTLLKATATVTVCTSEPTEVAAAHFGDAIRANPPAARENLATDLFDDDAASRWNTAPVQLLIDLPPTESRIQDLPPVDLANQDGRPAPALVLGIGGAAGRVLLHLRRGIQDQFGGKVDLPAIQLLLLDTDSRALTEVTQRDGTGLYPDETLNLALRRPQHYRDQAHKLLNWLSRRWLYNIPRSLRSEGLRPLGRLALVDHARQAGQRIRRALAQAIDPESLQKSATSIGKEFRGDTLRVFVVASISGGTGGGMSVDVAYMVRAVLEKLGLSSASITGIMLHATGGDPRHTELARVNAFAWLAELNHFSQPNSQYPGDPSCGLPQHAPGAPPFDQTYVVHAGENVDAAEFDQAMHGIADYLRLNLVSPAGAFFDACRCQDASLTPDLSEASPFGIRSFGVAHQTAAPAEVCEGFANVVGECVVASWLPTDTSAGKSLTNHDDGRLRSSQNVAPGGADIVTGTTQLVSRLQLESTGIAGNARSLVGLSLGGDLQSFLQTWLDKKAEQAPASDADLVLAMDQLFCESDDDLENGKLHVLGKSASEVVQPLSEKLRADVRRWIGGRIDDPRERLPGARRAVVWLSEHVEKIEAELQLARRSLAIQLTEVRLELVRVGSATAGARLLTASRRHSSRLIEYFKLWIDEVTFAAAMQIVREIRSDAKSIGDELTALGREIGRIAATVNRTADNAESDGNAHTRLATRFRAGLADLVTAVDARLQTEFISQHGGLLQVVMQGGRPRAQLTARLHEFSRQAVQHLLAGVSVFDDSTEGAESCSGNGLQSSLAIATPLLLTFGGTRRVLALMPRGAVAHTNDAEFSSMTDAGATVICGDDNNLTVCVEAAQLSLPHVALSFVQRRRDRVEFAERVHCRTDIQWMPLVTVNDELAPAEWVSSSVEKSCHTQSRQDVCKTLVM